MKVDIKSLKDLESELTIELDKNELLLYLKETRQEFKKDLQVEGFRKGKVPEEMLNKYVSDAELLELAGKKAIQDSFSKIIEEKKLEVLKTINVEILENSPEKLLYKVIVLTYPQIEEVDLSKTKVTTRAVVVDEAEIEGTLKNIQESRAIIQPKDGQAAKGDKAEVDFEIKDQGTTIAGGESKNHPVILGKSKFVAGFEENIIGMKVGEEKEFSLEIPKDYHEKNIAGKKLDFKVKLMSLESITLPELNDEFIKTLGKFENLDTLRQNIKDGIREEKLAKEHQRVRIEILEDIVKKSNIKAPQSLVEQQLDGMIQDFDAQLHKQGLELNLYLVHLNKTQDDLKKDWKSEAEKQVKFILAIHVLARQNGIVASDKDIEEYVTKKVDMLVSHGHKPQELNVGQIREEGASKIVQDKVFEFIEKACLIGAVN